MPLDVAGEIVSTSSFGSTSLVNNLVTDGLALYLDAGDPNSYTGSGNTWYDLSGWGRNATWGSASWTSNGNASYFNTYGTMCRGLGSNRYGIFTDTGYTITWISQTNTGSANAAFKFVDDQVTLTRGIFVHPGWSNSTIYFDQGGCCDSDTRTNHTFSAGDFTNWRVWTVMRNGNDRRIYMNGIMYAKNTTAAASFLLDDTQLYIGGDNDYASSTSSTWDGKLAVFMVHNRGLKSAEIYQNYFMLKSRFGL